MPFFSIIIPTFNSGKTLENCLASIIRQSFADFEIIIHDGLSKDNTVAVAEDIGDERIRIFSERDGGVYDAMNKALDKITGEWVLFLGGDDLLFTDQTLEQVKNRLGQTTAELVYGDVKIAGDSHWIKDGTIYMGETSIPLLFEQNLSHQSIFYHKKIFERGKRFSLHYPICADYDLNLYCFSVYNTQYIPEIISIFHTGGLSSLQTDTLFEEQKWVNRIRYYKSKLLNKNLSKFKREFRLTGKQLFKQRHYKLGLIALTAYLYQKLL